MKPVNNLFNELTDVVFDFGHSFVKHVLKYVVVDDTDIAPKTAKIRLIYSGVYRAEYSINASAIAGVEDLYRSANFGALMGIANQRMEDSINYGTFMASVNIMDGGFNASPLFCVASDVKRGYNVGGFSLCHDEVSENAYHGGIIAVAGTVSGRMRGIFTYCGNNCGDVVGIVNVTGRNKLSDRRDTKGRRSKGKQIGLINIDLSKPLLEGGLAFGWS